MPINSEHLASLTDADVVDQNGDKVGGVGQIYLDDATGQPAWVSVKSGLFGFRESFVPLQAAEVVGGNIQVPFAKDFVKDSPRVDAENHLDDSQQALLYDYYGVDRSSAPPVGETVGGADQTATFTSEQVADDIYDGRSDGEDEREAEKDAEDRAGEETQEYADAPARTDAAPEAGGPADEGADPAGDAGTTDEADLADEADLGDDAAVAGDAGPAATDAAAIGAGAAAVAAGGDDQESQIPPAHYQQANPAAQADWAAEEAPDEPVAADWSVPSTDPADEEPTQVSRTGYSADQPAAHSSAYEGHGGAAGVGAAAAADADGSGEFGAVEPVSAETADGAADSVADEAVTGAEHQTGTGFPEGADEPGALGAEGAVVGGAVAGGVAAAGFAASDTDTAAYEIPGAEQTDSTDQPAAFAADAEEPFDGGTLPSDEEAPEDEALDAGTQEDEALDAGTDAGVEDTGEPEVFGAEGYRPDRDGTEMTDEERERLNQARGAL